LIAVLQLHSPWALVLAVLPLAALYVSYRRYLDLNEQTRAVMETLADMVDKRDRITSQHSRRVTEHVQQILRAVGSVPLTEAETIVAAARIHDLGKIGVSDACLHKPGPLNADEWREMAQHPVIGAQLLKPLSMYQEGLAIVRHHHERWDGRGYPDGLAGEQIPFGARVLAVADAFDVMTSDRPYKRAVSAEQALDEIQLKSGTQFDPVVVQAFCRAMRSEVIAPRSNAVSAEA
jgi:HD-GYP domain-containing protein (c-di-GMP phosphodiesterase class II)